MIAVSKVPKLRFQEFNVDWQQKKIGDLGQFLGGGTPTKNMKEFWKGSIPWISSSDIPEDDIHNISYSKYITLEAVMSSATKIIPANSVLTVSRVGVGKVAISDRDVCTSQDFTNIISTSVDAIFLAYLLKSKRKNLLGFNQGTSIKGFTVSDLVNFEVYIPTLNEQIQIATYLSIIDKKINVCEKKIQLLKKYKKSVMQKIFSQKIRFKDLNGRNYPIWQDKKLSEILRYEQPNKYIVHTTEYRNNYTIPVLTAGKTFILGHTNERDNIYKNVPVIIFDDFTTACKYVDFPFKIKSSAIKILIAKPGTDTKVAFELLKQVRFSTGDHKRYWITESQQYSVVLPSGREQQKIADFLTVLDDRIRLEEKNCQLVKNFKKSLLQRMFV